jgi:hypothetical protein
VDDEQQPTPEQAPVPDARTRARDLLRRTAPVLRDVNARIEQNEALRETRDALAGKAGELVQKADEALGNITAIEGTVVEKPAAGSPTGAPSSSSSAPKPAPRAGEPAPSGERQPHWTKERVARMATAAATDAVRPHRPLVRRETKFALLVGAVAGIFVATVMRRR